MLTVIRSDSGTVWGSSGLQQRWWIILWLGTQMVLNQLSLESFRRTQTLEKSTWFGSCFLIKSISNLVLLYCTLFVILLQQQVLTQKVRITVYKYSRLKSGIAAWHYVPFIGQNLKKKHCKEKGSMHWGHQLCAQWSMSVSVSQALHVYTHTDVWGLFTFDVKTVQRQKRFRLHGKIYLHYMQCVSSASSSNTGQLL